MVGLQIKPFFLVCDVSASMAGVPINALNAALSELRAELSSHPVTEDRAMFCIIAFSDIAETLLPLDWFGRYGALPELRAGGGTSYRAAFDLLHKTITADVAKLKRDGHLVSRPGVFFLSDGMPADAWEDAYQRLTEPAWKLRPDIVAFGFGNMDAATVQSVATVKGFIADGSVGPDQALRETVQSVTNSIIVSSMPEDVTLDDLLHHSVDPFKFTIQESVPGFTTLRPGSSPASSRSRPAITAPAVPPGTSSSSSRSSSASGLSLKLPKSLPEPGAPDTVTGPRHSPGQPQVSWPGQMHAADEPRQRTMTPEGSVAAARERSEVIEVSIGPGSKPGIFEVKVVRSPAGEASAAVELRAAELLARRAEVQTALLVSAVSTRRLLHETERSVREIGQALFSALLGAGEVAGRYRASASLAAEREHALRVVLRIDTPELAGLPWEAMYDEAAGGYVCRHEQLVRQIPVASAVAPIAVRPPLRLLGVISAPRGPDSLDADKERDLLANALAAPIADGLITIRWAASATWDGLHDILLDGPWHALHFIGHGGFDPDSDEGILLLTRHDGRPDPIEASRFADLLRQARPMPRLVVLNSCSGATTGTTDLFAGTAAALTRAGVPAVAAMQFEITDTAAAAFARGFYTAITRGRGVDDAVSAGRIAILGTSSRTLEWVTPVLYLRGHHAQLFSTA